MLTDISVRSNLRGIEKKLSALAKKQLPFAAAQALTAVAEQVKQAEQKNMQAVLDRPTPFTLRSIRVRPARKNNPVATVFLQDIAARYLEPYEFGGVNKLNSKALLAPRDVRLNQYGNLPRNLLKRFKGRSDVFIGPLKTKHGMVNGIWQRIAPAPGKPGGLKLILKFEDAHPVRQHLGYRDLAKAVVARTFNREFGRSLAQALASAK